MPNPKIQLYQADFDTMDYQLIDVIAHLQLLGTGMESPWSNAEMIETVTQFLLRLDRLRPMLEDERAWETYGDELTSLYAASGIGL